MKNTLRENKRYAIMTILPSEIDSLMDFFKENNMKIDYPALFEKAKKENKPLYRIAITHGRVGGILSTIVCLHDININKAIQPFSNVDEFKEYLKSEDK